MCSLKFTARSILLLSVSAAAACTPRPAHIASPTQAAPADDQHERLAAADALLRRGCYDCLVDALQLYEAAISRGGSTAAEARTSAARAAALLAVRENEIGLKPHAYIERARQWLGNVSTASPELAGLIDIAEVIASGPAGQ